MLPSFHEHGYSIVPGVFTRSDLSFVSQELCKPQLKRSRAGARHLMSLRSASRLAQNAALIGIARGVLGAEALPFHATLFDKSPDSNWLVPWHQDTALPLTAKAETAGWGPWSTKDGVVYAHAPAKALTQVLALRVHLDDATDANGPLRVIPDTHLSGVLGDKEIEWHACESSAVECTVEAGGVIAMHPLVIHASSKSRSELPRRVLHIEYATRLDLTAELRLAIS